VTKVWERSDTEEAAKLLQPDDLITHLNGMPTPTAEEYIRVRDSQLAFPESLVGERFLLTIQRGPQTFQAAVPIVPSAFPSPYDWKQCPLSLRRNGFPHVFVQDGGITPEECGGPVVDRLGRVIGLNIARADAIIGPPILHLAWRIHLKCQAVVHAVISGVYEFDQHLGMVTCILKAIPIAGIRIDAVNSVFYIRCTNRVSASRGCRQDANAQH
jgi:hypothetical protein